MEQRQIDYIFPKCPLCLTPKSITIDSSATSHIFSLRLIPTAIVECSRCRANWRTAIDTFSFNVITSMTLKKPGTTEAGHQYKGKSLTRRDWQALIDPQLALISPDIVCLAQEIGEEQLIASLEGTRRSIAFSSDAIWTASWCQSVLASGVKTPNSFNFTCFPLNQVTDIVVQKREKRFLDTKIFDYVILEVLTAQQRVTRGSHKLDDIENDNVIYFYPPGPNYKEIIGPSYKEIILFSVKLREHLHKKKTKPIANSSGVDAIDSIERLAKLRDAGILTDEEFQTQKSTLLRKIGSE